MYTQIQTALHALADTKKCKDLARFFKTGKGEYGEGDKFIGVKVPDQRKIAKQFKNADFTDVEKLLKSSIHEYRLTGLLILTYQYEKAGETRRKQIYDFYLKNRAAANNWDLIDVTTPKIIGEWMLHHPEDRKILYDFAKSNNLWERRISILATFPFIRHEDFSDTLKIAEILVHDNHDLIHKAVGWMLREVGKRDQETEENFLQKYYLIMPRTMLRYAIEKFESEKRRFFMGKG